MSGEAPSDGHLTPLRPGPLGRRLRLAGLALASLAAVWSLATTPFAQRHARFAPAELKLLLGPAPATRIRELREWLDTTRLLDEVESGRRELGLGGLLSGAIDIEDLRYDPQGPALIVDFRATAIPERGTPGALELVLEALRLELFRRSLDAGELRAHEPRLLKQRFWATTSQESEAFWRARSDELLLGLAKAGNRQARAALDARLPKR
jgi:hypothetical protein